MLHIYAQGVKDITSGGGIIMESYIEKALNNNKEERKVF